MESPHFTKAIVRPPGKSIVKGLTSADLGAPNYDLALEQHRNYVTALEEIGLAVIALDADERFPDSTFVEDTALLTPSCAIVTRPGAESRRGETESIESILRDHYNEIATITTPGTIEAGDIMMVGNHFYIGDSERTNLAGANQMIAILKEYGMTGSIVSMGDLLHLKSGLSYLENNRMVVVSDFSHSAEFSQFDKLVVSARETYAANCVWINGFVLVAAGFPDLHKRVTELGYKTISLAMSEFQKVDGGLSCLSLRF